MAYFWRVWYFGAMKVFFRKTAAVWLLLCAICLWQGAKAYMAKPVTMSRWPKEFVGPYENAAGYRIYVPGAPGEIFGTEGEMIWDPETSVMAFRQGAKVIYAKCEDDYIELGKWAFVETNSERPKIWIPMQRFTRITKDVVKREIEDRSVAEARATRERHEATAQLAKENISDLMTRLKREGAKEGEAAVMKMKWVQAVPTRDLSRAAEAENAFQKVYRNQ